MTIFVMWVFAHALGCRFGELSTARPKWECLEHIMGAKTYVLYYAKAPKANKIREAPCGIVSTRGNPFGYSVLHAYARRSRTRGSDIMFPTRSPRGAITDTTRSFTTSDAVSQLQQWLTKLGAPGVTKYTGHSARRGMLNDKRSSTPIQIIAMQGHWSPLGETAKREYSYYFIAERSSFL